MHKEDNKCQFLDHKFINYDEEKMYQNHKKDIYF